MKKRYWALAALLLLCGVGLLAYPAFSNWLAIQSQDTTIRLYEREVEQMSEEELAALWAAARAYNDKLPAGSLSDPFGTIEVAEDYLSLLNIDGVMGYIDIPSVEISLPIYHGTADEVLRRGAGHLFGSALPIGGAGSHTVLTSHSGLSSAKLFTDLEEVAHGDRFTVQVLDATLVYEVDRILVVEPHEVESIYPVEGEDYITLITCTPYAINSHRLLVRGARVLEEVQSDESAQAGGESPQAPSEASARRALPFAAAAVAGCGVLVLLVALRRRDGKGDGQA